MASGTCAICDITYLFNCETCGKSICEDCMEGTKCTDCADNEEDNAS